MDDNKRIIESGNIIYANLILSGENNSLYYFDKEEALAIMIKMAKA